MRDFVKIPHRVTTASPAVGSIGAIRTRATMGGDGIEPPTPSV